VCDGEQQRAKTGGGRKRAFCAPGRRVTHFTKQAIAASMSVVMLAASVKPVTFGSWVTPRDAQAPATTRGEATTGVRCPFGTRCFHRPTPLGWSGAAPVLLPHACHDRRHKGSKPSEATTRRSDSTDKPRTCENARDSRTCGNEPRVTPPGNRWVDTTRPSRIRREYLPCY